MKISNVNIVVTRFEFSDDQYVYTANRQTHDNTNGWTLLRREITKPNIPPCIEQLTKDGWYLITSSHNSSVPVVFLDQTDVVRYVIKT